MITAIGCFFTIYGTKPGLELPSLTPAQLEEKARFCRSFIRYLAKIDPGYSQGPFSNDKRNTISVEISK